MIISENLVVTNGEREREKDLIGVRTTEDEMAGWHHRFNGHEFGWTPGVGDG